MKNIVCICVPHFIGYSRSFHVCTSCWCFYFMYYSAAIYANRHYLNIYHRTHPERLAKDGTNGPTIIGDVFIHPTATVDPTAVVSIWFEPTSAVLTFCFICKKLKPYRNLGWICTFQKAKWKSFISIHLSWASGGGAIISLSHIHNMGISYSHNRAGGSLNFT